MCKSGGFHQQIGADLKINSRERRKLRHLKVEDFLIWLNDIPYCMQEKNIGQQKE